MFPHCLEWQCIRNAGNSGTHILYDPQIHRRKSLRLQLHDYCRRRFYFVTIFTERRVHLFGKIVGAGSEPAQSKVSARMHPNELGIAVRNTWLGLIAHNPNIKLHEFVLMPNHVHGVIEIISDDAGHGLAEIIRQFKTFSARKINAVRNSPGEKVWQRGFHDHIIRNRDAYLRITGYIRTNPRHWRHDRLFM